MLLARILEVSEGLISERRMDSIIDFAVSGDEKWEVGVPR